MAKTLQGSEFHVILDGLKLKPDAEKRVEEGIRKLIMSELASLDLKGDLTLVPRGKFPSAFIGPIGGGTQGIYLRLGGAERE